MTIEDPSFLSETMIVNLLYLTFVVFLSTRDGASN